MLNPLAQRLELFTRLSQADQLALDRVTRRSMRDVGPRHDVVREGDPPRTISLLLRGWACRYKMLEDGRRQIVAFFVPGDFCDLNIYILREMDHSIAAITPIKVAEIAREDFEMLTGEHPRVLQALYWYELVSSAIQREWTLNLGQRTAYERIAHLLCEMFLRLESVGLARSNSCDFPLTQVDLADATGLTPVHVNRTLQELRRNGLIELQAKTLTIPDMAALRNAGMFNANYLHLDREGRQFDAND